MKPPIQATYITIGKIGAIYGVHGWLKIHSYTEKASSILELIPWSIPDEKGHWQPIKIEDKKILHQKIIVKFADIHTPEQAKLLTGKKIEVKRTQLPPLQKNEYYWSDLEGLTVVNKQGKKLGVVAFLIATGANDVVVIKNERGQKLGIPYLMGKVIKEVHLEQQKIIVDWEES